MIKNILPCVFLLKSFKILPKIQCKSLLMNNKQHFGPKKVMRQENAGNIIIKNDNLKFETEDYELHFYPFHPQVTKKTSNIYEINKLSTVVAFSFILKSSSMDGKYSQEGKANWFNRKSIALKFNQLSQLVDVNPTQDKKWSITALSGSRQKRVRKVLAFKNLKAQRNYEVTLEQFSADSETPEESLKTKMSHVNFEILQFLLKESLFDLSGMKLMFDLKRNEQLAKISEKDKASLDKDDLFREYGNKDNVV